MTHYLFLNNQFSSVLNKSSIVACSSIFLNISTFAFTSFIIISHSVYRTAYGRYRSQKQINNKWSRGKEVFCWKGKIKQTNSCIIIQTRNDSYNKKMTMHKYQFNCCWSNIFVYPYMIKFLYSTTGIHHKQTGHIEQRMVMCPLSAAPA